MSDELVGGYRFWGETAKIIAKDSRGFSPNMVTSHMQMLIQHIEEGEWVSSTKELSALTAGSIVRTKDGAVYERDASHIYNPGFLQIGSEKHFRLESIPLPVRVIFRAEGYVSD